MRRRVGRPSLLGTAARTAVIAGTATAVSGSVAQKQQAATQQAATQQAQAAPATAAGTDLMSQLQQLASMHQAGVLSDAEFAAAKAKLLA